MRKLFLQHTVLTLILIFGPLLGQNYITLPTLIDTAIVVGNKHTKSHIILREIPFTLPDTLDKEDLLQIKNRIQNLYLFNRVELQLARQEEKTILIISVTETWYFFPLPILFINERDWGKISYGMQFIHFNFRGQNEKLRIGGWLGYNPSFFLEYLNPWIGNKKRIIVGVSLFYNLIANKIFDFDEQRAGINLLLGRQITLKFKTEIEFELQSIRLPRLYQQYSVSKTGHDIVPSFSFHLRYDDRDLYEYPRKGFYIDYLLKRTGFRNNQPRFWRFIFDNRFYHPVYKEISLAIRNLLYIQSGNLPIYDRMYLGFYERIRGYFNRVFPPTSDFRYFVAPEISLSSLEIRFPILPIRYFSYEGIPMLSTFSRDLKFGLSAGIFVDSGIAWQKSSEFSLKNHFTGFGVGLHIHFPYINVLRLDYAWNDQGHREFIVDIGVAF